MGRKKKVQPDQNVQAETAAIVSETVQKPEFIVIEMIDTKDIVPSLFNPRKFDGEDRKISELSRSIETKCLIEPIHVRPISGGRYEIIFGERRWRACTMLAREKMECIVRGNVDENAAREMIAIEYFQREDLTLLEEAEGIQMYLDTGVEAAAVAENIGKPVGWVLKRAKLRDLSDRWKEALADPENPFSEWSVSHLEVMVRFSSAVQDQIMDFLGSYYGAGTISVGRLKDLVSKYLKKLASAPWPLDAEIEGCAGGTCHDCMKRSGAQPVLFDDMAIEPKDDSCLDHDCFDRKLNAWLETQAASLKDKHTDLVLVDGSNWSVKLLPEGSAIKKDAIVPTNYLSAEEGDEGAFPAFIVDGPEIGQMRYCRIRPNEPVDPTRPYNPRDHVDEHGNKLPTPLSVRRARLDKRRMVRYIETVMSNLDEADSRNVTVMTENVDERKVLSAILAFGAQRPGGFYRDEMTLWNAYHASFVGEYDREKTLKDLLMCVVPIWQKMLYAESKVQNPSSDVADQVCAYFDWPAETWKEDARAELPDPASWASLNEDGTPKSQAAEEPEADTADDAPEVPASGEIEDAEFEEVEDTVYDTEYSQEFEDEDDRVAA